jgi:small-conductance mechanosensitive channel
MPSIFKPIHKPLLALLFLAVAIFSVMLLINPAAVYPDAAWGFQVLRSMRSGNGFNILTQVSQQNIADNWTEFKSWWSPGQYLVPGAFNSLFGLTLGQASSVTTIICQFLGLAGLYCFFIKAGFSKNVSAVSILIIALQQAFFTPYIFYNGGEVLVFAFIGWFLYGCMAFKKPGVPLLLFILLSGWVGFFTKSSFMWMYAAGLISIWIQLSRHITAIKNWLINGFWVGIPAVISVAVIYISYLSKGVNPSSASSGLDLSWKVLAFPLASPLLSGLSFDDLANGLILHNDDVIFNPAQSILIITVLALLSVLLIYSICKRLPGNRYSIMLVVFYIVSILFFGSAFLRKLDISYEARHFRVIGLLFTPGLVYLISGYKRVYQYAFGAVVLIVAFFTLRFYALSYIALKTETLHAPSGIAQQFIDKPSLDYLRVLDSKSNNSVFVFFSPDLGLEIQHNRVITLDPLNADISINTDDYTFKGHAGPVYILMPHEYIGIRASVILKSFPGYKGFSLKELSDDYVLYFATEAR